MKKAKIMLSALGVLAIAGSALAFKAHNMYTGSLRCTAFTTSHVTNCPLSTYTTTADGATMLCTATGAASGATCVTATVIERP